MDEVKGNVVSVHCCDSCAINAGIEPKFTADSGIESWYCDVCGHYGIGSTMDCEIGDWLVLRPLKYNIKIDGNPDKVIIGDCELWLGDCRDVLPLLQRVDAIISDPPYGVELGSTKGSGGAHGLQLQAYESYVDTYENYVNEIVPALKFAISKADRAAIFIGQHIHEMPKFDALGGVYCSAATGRHQWGFKNFLPVLLYGTYPDLQKGAKYPTVIASNETAEKNGHPVPKPIGWMLWLVNLATRNGEAICDPFMGSGTTGVACVNLGRKFIGIERERKYFDIAVERIKQAYAQPRLFEDAKPAPQQQTML